MTDAFSPAVDADQVTEIVRSIVVMGRGLDLAVVAEGVHTRQHLEILREFGCPYGEGPLFAPPLDAEAATRLLGEDPHW